METTISLMTQVLSEQINYPFNKHEDLAIAYLKYLYALKDASTLNVLPVCDPVMKTEAMLVDGLILKVSSEHIQDKFDDIVEPSTPIYRKQGTINCIVITDTSLDMEQIDECLEKRSSTLNCGLSYLLDNTQFKSGLLSKCTERLKALNIGLVLC
jgi:hypothetical protein